MQKHYGPLVRLLHCAIDREIGEALEQVDLTASQGHIMGYLARQQGPVYAKDIEEVFHLSHPTVSGLLARLERKGFLCMQTDEKDRRCKKICIQRKGEETAAALYQAILRSEAKLVEGFSPEEQAQFRSLLIRALSNLGGWPTEFPKDPQSPKEEPKP